MGELLLDKMCHDVHNLFMKNILMTSIIIAMAALGITNTEAAIARESERTECHFQGQSLREGQSISWNCTNCTCIGGSMNYNQMKCPVDQECIHYEKLPGLCCPVCVEWGCTYKGMGYPRGSKIPSANCHFCFCPWKGGNGGNPVCSKVQCPPAHCVDGTVPYGKCCPTCPNGSNCWMGDLLISPGQETWISPCRSCTCQQEKGNGYVELKAKCSWRFEQKTCPYGK